MAFGLGLVQLGARVGELALLQGITLEVARGEHVCLIGPSGAGKTTLLRCVAGLHEPVSGRVEWSGEVWSDGPRLLVPPERRGIGMVAQDLALWTHLDARRHLQFTARVKRRAAAKSEQVVWELLERVGLTARATHRPSELSGGEGQRLALARALLSSSGLLLFDEPLGQLDVTLRGSLARDLASLARDSDMAVLHVTHDAGEALTLGDRVAVLEGGRIVQCATPAELGRAPATRFVARAAGLVNHLPADRADAFLALTSVRSRPDSALVRLSDGSLVFSPDALAVVPGRDAVRAGRRFSGERWLDRWEWQGHGIELRARAFDASTCSLRSHDDDA